MTGNSEIRAALADERENATFLQHIAIGVIGGAVVGINIGDDAVAFLITLAVGALLAGHLWERSLQALDSDGGDTA
jgi:divalent metal cation (Fe/Co/Zn/Cd) transporter